MRANYFVSIHQPQSVTSPRSNICGIVLLAIVILLSCCSHVPRRFPLAEPFWQDPDSNHVPKQPSKYYSGLIADGADQMFFRRLSNLLAFHLPGESINVNAIDEVPDSAWFQNRIGLFPITPQQAARGACTDPPLDPTQGLWIVSDAKPDGANPGFFVKTPSGTFLLKFDGFVQPQRATAADVIGSKFYWTAGYHTPCNQIVYFRPSILQIGKDAVTKNKYGEETRLTQKEVDIVLSKAFRLKNGIARASASKFIEGKPIGPFRYEGRRGDDPNDVISHEDRRELRANRLLAAWLNHFDTREQNTLDMWVKQGNREFIRHYYIDWGDCLGSRWTADALSRRLGHSYYLDLKDVTLDLLTLGTMPRPWHRAVINKEAEIFGYYSDRDFIPSKWKGGYPNPAFERMTFRDALWMVRIISRFTDAHIQAIVAEGKLTSKRAERYLVKTLIKRRDLIIAEYLTRYAPLDRFRLVRRTRGSLWQSLCFEDLAIKHRAVSPKNVLYKLRFYGGSQLDTQLGWLQFAPDPNHPHRSCVVLPIGDKRPSDLAPKGSKPDHPLRYGLLKIYIHQKPAVPPTSIMDVHLYDLGPRQGYQLVGLIRQPEPMKLDLYY